MKVRRQNQSCDQCRRSKKACDGHVINQAECSISESPIGRVLPCSYCVKTKKACGLHPHWAQLRTSPMSCLPSANRSNVVETGYSKPSPTEEGSREALSMPTSHTSLDAQVGDVLEYDPSLTPERWIMEWNTPSLEWPSDLDIGCSSSSFHHIPMKAMADGNFTGHYRSAAAELAIAPNCRLGETTSTASNMTEYTDSTVLLSDYVLGDNFFRGSAASQPTFSSQYSPPAICDRTGRIMKHRKPRRQTHASSRDLSYSISPFDSNSDMMSSTNNYLISESLQRIYHDVLENNLACWLTDDTCPYKMPSHRYQLQSQPVPSASRTADAVEWGATWSNRMYRRVRRLDQAAQAAGVVNLTRTEHQCALKALNLTIMAFASQWSQTSQRRRRFPSEAPETTSDYVEDISDGVEGGFEQHLQYSMWESARRALGDVEDLESFKAVYGFLIFGLMEKPQLKRDDSQSFRESPTSADPKASTLLRIRDIMTRDGPSTYIAKAAQKIQLLRSRVEANEVGFMDLRYRSSADQWTNARQLTAEERGTVGLLYWMAVMFDTVSSSSNERPVTLADEHCQHDENNMQSSEEGQLPSISKHQASHHRWSLALFARDNPNKPSIVRWPCAYDSAAEAITRSAAVKVLLYRYVAYAQQALRKQRFGQYIEDILHSATLVYRYWNMTHGVLFRDLINSYDDLPARIKSWFPCIHIPWQLGALLLADLIDFVDQNELGLHSATASRRKANMTGRMRKSSSSELSNIARVAAPHGSADASRDQLPSYHFAVSEGTLLTEPWTVLLVRAFTKAGIYHLSTADGLCRALMISGHDSDDFKESMARCYDCVKALWFLGRKSDLAKSVGEVLAEGLSGIEARSVNQYGESSS